MAIKKKKFIIKINNQI